MAFLVTGGCGFIGSNFVRLLRRAEPGQRVVNLDALTYAGNPANLSDLENDSSYQFVHGDISDRPLVDRVLSEHSIEAVFHFAAESHVDRSILDSGPFIRTNVLGTQTLLDASRAAKVRRFVHVSTDEVYGSLGEEGFFSETTPLAPNSPYAASKASSDMLVRACHHTHGFDTVITRCSNNYGPYQFPEKLIPLVISNIEAGLPIPVYGDGLQVRDWIHVADHAAGVLAAFRNGKAGEAYNFGGRCEKTNISLVKTLLNLMGKPETLIRHVADRPGHDRRYAIDCSKAERELGWQVRVDFSKGLADTVGWYRANPGWVETIRSGDYRRYYQSQYGHRGV
ncbi:MAG: dTDP-glucose 4,6-dehydratase [Planctomycetota bacterium]